DDRAPGDPNPSLQLYAQQGQYFIAVAAGGDGTSTGAYTLRATFRPGHDDFVTTTSADLPLLVINTFDPADVPSRLGVRRAPAALLAADFNRDGVLDLATADRGSGTVSVLLGNGDGTPHTTRTFSVGGRPATLVTADFNRDGRADLAVLDPDAGTVDVL